MKAVFMLVLLLLSVGFVAGNGNVCVPIEACVDGSDFLYLDGAGNLRGTHGDYDPIGQHSGCSGNYIGNIRIDDVFYPIELRDGFGSQYFIDGTDVFEFPVLGMNSYNVIDGRGPVSNYHGVGVYINDNDYGGSSVYKIEFCGIPSGNGGDVPEFTVIGAGAIALGAAGYAIWRRRK